MLLASCSLLAVPASATTISIDFEHTPGIDGVLGTADDVPMASTFLQPLGAQFAALGLTFSQGSLLQDSFYDGNPLNHFISSTNPIARLTKAASAISIDSYSIWDATLTAFDIDGNLISSVELINPNAGSSFLRGQLSLTSTQHIYGFSVMPNNPNRILNLDNLVLTMADQATDVPEPPATAMFALGLAIAGFSMRARARKRG
jgi:hypothetical protein